MRQHQAGKASVQFIQDSCGICTMDEAGADPRFIRARAEGQWGAVQGARSVVWSFQMSDEQRRNETGPGSHVE
jgi:hypothetical protein